MGRQLGSQIPTRPLRITAAALLSMGSEGPYLTTFSDFVVFWRARSHDLFLTKVPQFLVKPLIAHSLPERRKSLVAVVEGGLRGHGNSDLSPLEVDTVEPLHGGVRGVGFLVLDDAVALRLARVVVLVDTDGERPLVFVAPLLLGKCRRVRERNGGRRVGGGVSGSKMEHARDFYVPCTQ